jgi:cytochrome b involved in lipid metabolism
VTDATAKRGRTVTRGELARHNRFDDAWVAVKGQVFNITPWIHMHPGGSGAIAPFLGKDGSAGAMSGHSYLDVNHRLRSYYVGDLV